MSPEDAITALESLQRRRHIIGALLTQTRGHLEPLLAELKETADPDPKDIVRVQLLTFQGNILLRLMAKLADEAAALALELKNTNKIRRAVAPTINPDEIQVPDHMPEQL